MTAGPAPSTVTDARKLRGLALGVSLVVVGGGHVLLGRWRRGGLWLIALVACLLSVPWSHNLGLGGVGVIYLATAGDTLFIAPRPRPESVVLAVWLGGLITLLVSLRFVVVSYYVQAYKIPSGAMSPTLLAGDHVMVARFRRHPGRGDVIIFRYPEDPRQDFVKRVVGLAGDRVEVRDGTLLVNGVAAEESSARDCTFLDHNRDRGWNEQSARCAEQSLGGRRHAVAHVPARDPSMSLTFPQPGSPAYTVPAGTVFVMGDNREDSYDSRFFGAVPVGNIKGTVLYVWWSSANGKTRWGRVGQRVR